MRAAGCVCAAETCGWVVFEGEVWGLYRSSARGAGSSPAAESLPVPEQDLAKCALSCTGNLL